MKQGFEDVKALAAEVRRQQDVKRDFAGDTRMMGMDGGGNFTMLLNGNRETFEGNKVFHAQLGEKLGIPKRYYDLMKDEAPRLLSDNVNHWLSSNPEKRFVRTLDGKARAFLSNNYRPLDNSLVMEAAMRALTGTNVQVTSSQITDQRFYLKVTFPDLEASIDQLAKSVLDNFLKDHGAIHPRDYWSVEKLQPGLVISNSEVGCGAVSVESLIYTIRCRNGAIFSGSLRKFHIGKGLSGEEGISEFFSNATRAADDKAFVMKIHDVVKAACNPEIFHHNVAKIAEASSRIITGNIETAVDSIVEKFDMSEGEHRSMLDYLVRGGDFSQWGVSSAITRMSQDVESYDRATELERLGGKVIELPPHDWVTLVGRN